MSKEQNANDKFLKIPLIKNQIENVKSKIKPKPNKKLLLFDIDNTLYLENNGMDTDIRNKLYDFGLEYVNGEDSMKLMGEYYNKYGLTIKGYLKEKNASVKVFNEIYNKIDIEKYLKKDEEMHKAINEFKNNYIYAFTNGSYEIGMRMIDSLGLTDCFDGIIYCEYLDGGDFLCKPEDAVYQFIEELFDMNGEDVYVFEDRIINLVIPMKRGWKSYLVGIENDLKKILKELDYLK